MIRMNSLVGVCAVLAIGAGASARPFVWDWHKGDPGNYGINNAGGAYESIHATYDSVSNTFSWRTVFSNQITTSFTLAVNNGPNPKGHNGELGLLYFDARNPGAVKLTAYAYNGKNSSNSWKDGDGVVTGNQTPDLLRSSTNTSWIQNISSQDIGGKRILSFTVDAGVINSHTPMYPHGSDWTGLQFDQKLGLWFHASAGLDAAYNAKGLLTKWNTSHEGWFDGSNFNTHFIPLPGTPGLAGAGLLGVMVLRRRRPTA